MEPDGDETAEHLEYESEETDQETSEYEPDVDCDDNEEENGSDEVNNEILGIGLC